MTTAVALLVLGLIDGGFSGFRSSVGRTGMVDHRASDRIALGRGAVLVSMLLVPSMAIVLVEYTAVRGARSPLLRAGHAMLAVYLPYGALVLAALLVYGALSWRLRYLSSALILGPFTLIRPLVAIAGGIAGCIAGGTAGSAIPVALAVLAVLAVARAADRIWYRERVIGPSHPGLARSSRRRTARADR